uniref:F-box domain-containing protein n=1 Tax=Leersia perrieri TaxID=77586 RepID=A0A0D9XU43_9ORYZ
MEHGDGDLAGGGVEDRLSLLPGDILLQILLLLGTSSAIRSSVLCRRWRLLWRLLPALDFPPRADGNSIRAALAAGHEGLPLRHLRVISMDSRASPVADWLPVAARRLSGGLYLFVPKPERDSNDDEEEEDGQGGTFLEIPCFESATSLKLDLGFLDLALPPSAGVFVRLTKLSLRHVWFRGHCDLGDAVSSPQFPSLKKLIIRNAQGLNNLDIHSDSLLEIVLENLMGLQQLNVVAPRLRVLHVVCCFVDRFARRQPVADIAAPNLKILWWSDAFDPSTVQFSNMSNLQLLSTYHFFVYGGPVYATHNRDCLRLLQRFQFDAIPSLSLMLAYWPDIIDSEYLMEDMTVLPNIAFVYIKVFNENGQCIGPSLFHILKMCTDIRGLKLELGISGYQEGNVSQVNHAKRLFSWAATLKEMTINFCDSITESIAKEMCKKLLSFTRPEIHMKFYIHRGAHNKVLYVPEEPASLRSNNKFPNSHLHGARRRQAQPPETRLGALPDDILIQILLCVVTVDAARTNILSRQWRRLWCLLPKLWLAPPASVSPDLLVLSMNAGHGPIMEWLPVAIRSLSEYLLLFNRQVERDSKEEEDDDDFLELPCFGSAISLSLDLGFLALAVPPSSDVFDVIVYGAYEGKNSPTKRKRKRTETPSSILYTMAC